MPISESAGALRKSERHPGNAREDVFAGAAGDARNRPKHDDRTAAAAIRRGHAAHCGTRAEDAAVEIDVDHLADRRRASNVEPRILATMLAQCTKWVSGSRSFVAWQTPGRFRP